MRTAQRAARSAIGLAVCWTLFAPQPAAAEIDHGLWLSASAKMDLPHGLDLGLENELRWNENASQLERVLPSAELKYKALPWLDLGVGYRFQSERSNSGDFEPGHRQHLQASAERDLGPTEISYRLRFQREREFEDPAAEYSARNRVGASLDTGTRYMPYFSAELFTDADDGTLLQNKVRLTLGSAIKLNKRHRIKLAGLYQHKLDDGDIERIATLSYSYDLPKKKRKKRKKRKKA